MTDLYVYYEVRETHAAQLEPRVRAMQASLHQAGGAAAQLKRRPETKNGLQTWMEVYSGVSEEFVATLEAASLACGVPDLIEGKRHTEVFTDLMTCA